MSCITDVTGKILKHYAQDIVTNQRYIIVSLQNDTDPDSCSVIDIDALDADTRSELINIVNSDECQRVPEIWKILDRKYFMNYPKATVLNVLKLMKQIKVVKSAQVMVELPGDQRMTPKQIVDCINKYEESKNGNTKFHADNTETTSALVSVENKNASDIAEVKSEIANINTQISSLTSSISDLIKALNPKHKEDKK